MTPPAVPGAKAGSASTSSEWQWHTELGPWGLPALFALVVVAYGAGSRLAIALIEASGLQGVFFIPAGITVAFLMRLPKRHWWLVLLGAGLAEFTMDVAGGFTSRESLGFAIANMSEPLVGAAIVTVACGQVDLARRRHLAWFALGAVLIGPMVGAGIGAIADQVVSHDDFIVTFSQWWLGDALGVVIVGSAILAWGSSPDRRSLLSVWGAVVLVGSAASTIAVLTLTDWPLVFVVLIGVVLAGALFGIRAVAMTSLVVATTLAVILAFDTGSLIVGLSQAEALVLIKLQMATFALAGLLIAAEAHERERAVEDAARSSLEARALDWERQREQALAIRVQRGLLPDRVLQHPRVDIAARYEAASELFEVGGDWYDTLELGDNRIGLVVGDIVGHGIEAMTSMGRLRTALAALALHNQSPAGVLGELDEFVGGPDGTGYATVLYAVVDLEARKMTYSSAGHPPALLLRPSHEPVWLDRGQSEPLYGQPSAARREATLDFEPGSTLVFYSDGLIERRGESLDLGMERLRRMAIEIEPAHAEAMCDALFAGLASSTGRTDDVVVLVMRAEPRPPTLLHEIFPAEPDQLRHIRSAVRSWMATNPIPPVVADDLLLAIGEATSNAVRHAYHGSVAGIVEVRIALEDHRLNVEVSDRGRWHPPDPETAPGLGTDIIRSVSDGLQVEHDERGTRLRFSLPSSG